MLFFEEDAPVWTLEIVEFFISFCVQPRSTAGTAQGWPLTWVWLLSMPGSCRGSGLASGGESMPSRKDGPVPRRHPLKGEGEVIRRARHFRRLSGYL
jgi:hypothetical protein